MYTLLVFCFSWIEEIVKSIFPDGRHNELIYIHPGRTTTHIVMLSLLLFLYSVKTVSKGGKREEVAASQLSYKDRTKHYRQRGFSSEQELQQLTDHFSGIAVANLNWHKDYETIRSTFYGVVEDKKGLLLRSQCAEADTRLCCILVILVTILPMKWA